MTLLGKLVPLVVLSISLAFAAFVGYAAYTIATDIADKTSKKMEKKNVSFGKEGMKIGVKEVKTENYVDQTQKYGLNPDQLEKLAAMNVEGQRGAYSPLLTIAPCLEPSYEREWLTSWSLYSLLVKAWNYSSWPAYKSRFWNKENEQPQKTPGRSS